MRICSRLPSGARLYKQGQKRIGRLGAGLMKRLPTAVKMVRWLIEQGMQIEDCTFLEVGTGHIPLVPICFFLSGAGQVITVDLHRRIDWGLTRATLEWIASHRRELEKNLYLKTKAVFDERFATIVKEQSAPQSFLESARIVYLAPMDAANTKLPENSVDCHFSVTTLEHIQKWFSGMSLLKQNES